nr:unnamed protein product [Callosobruchus chinensis]
MDDTKNKHLNEIKKLNKKKRILAPWQMPPLKRISFKLARDKADEKLLAQLQNECDNPNYYHLIKLTRTHSYNRLYILKSISEFVYPSEFIPCHYFQCATEVRFLARRCKEALLKIVNNNFLVRHYPTGSSRGIGATFEAAIVANFCEASVVEVDRSENVLKVLKSRFEEETGVLDLSNFVADKGLKEYSPLSQPRMLLYVIYLSTELGNVKTINLKDNCIKHITCLDVLKNSGVETVDLTYNQIQHIDDIKGISDASCIKNLKLEHNPLCSNYDNYNYVVDVKKLLPNLETLDAVDVTTPLFKKNFVCSADAQDLVQQFMTHFFTIYDSEDREDLKQLYENNAFFSVNVHVIPFQKNSYSVRLSHYGLKHPFTVQSREQIMKIFKSFPRTQHDIYTFPDYVVLTVGGIFKELNQILGFSRTFVLRNYKESYTIANDQMVIYNATDYQLGWSFSFPLKVEHYGNPLPYYPEQLLDYCDYDVSKALNLFSELSKNDMLPDKAFQRQKGFVLERSLQDPSQATTKTLWNVLNTNRLQRCEDKVPNFPTNVTKIQRSTKPIDLKRHSLQLSDNQDVESNASLISRITNQTIRYVNSNDTVVCDTSSDSQAVAMSNVRQASDPYAIAQRIQAIANEKAYASPSSNSNDPCEDEFIVSKSVNSGIHSPKVGDEQRGSETAVPSNDDDEDAIHNNADKIVEASPSLIGEKVTDVTDSTARSSASTSKQVHCRSQLIEEIMKERNRAANYAGKFQEIESPSIESTDKNSDTMSQREIDNLYHKVNKNSFPWLNCNHTRRFKYLLQKRLVSRKLCDIVTDGLKRKQMSELLDEELTATRLEVLYLDGYLAKESMGRFRGSSSVNPATYLSQTQTERLQWLLNKELISENYHRYFSSLQIKAMTSQCLSTDRLKTLFEQGYLKRDPSLLTNDNQNSSVTREGREKDDNLTFPDFRDFRLHKRGIFFQKLVTYLRSNHPDRGLNTFEKKYLVEYIPYRRDEVILAAQYAVHVGNGRVKVLNILHRELHFQKTAVVEKAIRRSRQRKRKSGDIDHTTRKRSINRDHEQPSSFKKPKLGSNDQIDVMVLEDDDEPGSSEEKSVTQMVNHNFTAEELVVVKYLRKKHKHRLQWLLDNNLLGKKYFKYLKLENLHFITKATLTMQRLWVLFTNDWLIRDPTFLYDNGKQNAPVQRSNFSPGIYNKGPIISQSKYCRKLYNYLNMTPERRARNVSGLKEYLEEYTPYRYNEVICTVKYALTKKHRWDEISAVLLNDGLITNLVDLEIDVFGFVQPLTENVSSNSPEVTSTVTEDNEAEYTHTEDNFNSISTFDEGNSYVRILESLNSIIYYSSVEIEDVGTEEFSFDPSLYLKPYFVKPRSREVTEDKLQVTPYIEYQLYPNNNCAVSKSIEKILKTRKTSNKEIENENTNDEKIIRQNCRHLNETQKDRIRLLLRHNLLGERCYTYLKPNDWKYMSAKTFSMFRLWHLYDTKQIIRDPGFLFEKDIVLAKQKALVHTQGCIDPVDKYCLSDRCDQFSIKLRCYLMGRQTKSLRNYMLDHAPYRYNDMVAAVKSFKSLCTLSEVSAVLEQDRLIKNADQFETDVKKLQTEITSCNICNSTKYDKTSNDSMKRKLSTGLELAEINDEEFASTAKAQNKLGLTNADLEDISDEESPILLEEIADTSVAALTLPNAQEAEVVLISDEEEIVLTNSNNVLASNAISPNTSEMKRRKKRRAKKRIPVTNEESGLLSGNSANPTSDVIGEDDLDPAVQSEMCKLFNLDKNEKLYWLVQNGFLSRDFKIYFPFQIKLLADCDTPFLLWNYFKEGLFIKDPTAICESDRIADYFYKKAGDRLIEVNGEYIYKHNLNSFIQKLDMFVRSQLSHENHSMKSVQSYLLEHIPYRRNEVLAFVKEALGEFDWTEISFALAHLMPEKDVAQLETDVYKFLGNVIPEGSLCTTTVSSVKKMVKDGVHEYDSVTIDKSELIKFVHLRSQYQRFKWLIDNKCLSKNYLTYFPFAKIQTLLRADSLFRVWRFFKEGLLIRDPTLVYASEQHDHFNRRGQRQLEEVDGKYIYKFVINIFIQKLRKYVCGKLQSGYSADGETHLKEYLIEYIPYRRYEVIAFIRHALNAFEWTQISASLADIMHEEDLHHLKSHVGSRKDESTSEGCLQYNMQLVPYNRTPWVCQSVSFDEPSTTSRYSLDNAVFIRRLDPLKQDRLRWLIHKNLISKHFFVHISRGGILKLARETFSMYTLWFLFHAGLLRINPSFLFESSFTAEQQQAMALNSMRNNLIQQIHGHYVLKRNRFRSNLNLFVSWVLNKICDPASHARRKAYLLEYIQSRQYDTAAEIQFLSTKYSSKQLRELLEKELGKHFIGELGDLEQIEVLDDESTSIGIANTYVYSRQDESTSEGCLQYNMQLVPYNRTPWVCQSVSFDEPSTTSKYSLDNAVFIRRLDPLKQDRLRWLIHKNLISKHFFVHISRGGIRKLARETFSMYTLWFLFHAGLLRINPSFLFESSFTAEQQQAMALNSMRNNLIQQIRGHYVLKRNRFRSNLNLFVSWVLNKICDPASHARRKAYLLEYIQSRQYDTAAEIQFLSTKYSSKQLRELLEKELGEHFIGELGDLEQIEVLDDESTSIGIANTSVEYFPTNSLEESSSQKANDMQIVPYLPLPWEASDQTNLFEGSCEKRNASTAQAESKTMEFNDIEEEQIAVLRCLNEVQRDRIRWLLEKNLLSRLYYKYFSLIQLRNITCSALTRENLWSYFAFGYLKRDPDFLFETSQSFNIPPPNVALKDTPSGYRRGTLFRRKFHSFLLSALSDTSYEDSVVRNYVSEYATHRYEELAKILRYWSEEHLWSELSAILENKLSLRNIEELERRVYGYAVIDKVESIPLKHTLDKPSHDVKVCEMQIVPYIPHPWKKSEQKEVSVVVESSAASNEPRSVKVWSSEIDPLKKREITVLRCLNAVQKDRLQWLVDNKLLCESYYDYFSASELKFISNDALCLPKLWHLFFDGYLIQNPEDLFGKKISLELKKGFYLQYKFLKTETFVECTDSARIIKEVQAFLESPELQMGRIYEGIINQRDERYDQGWYPSTNRKTSIQFAADMTFGQKLISYIVVYIEAKQSDANILSRLRKYLLDYLPFRLENVTIILKHVIERYPWSTLKGVFQASLPVYDISCLEERLFGGQGGRITDCVSGSEINTSDCMQIVPYIPPTWGLMRNNAQAALKTEIGANNEFQLADETVVHLTELEKDRLRWLLTRKLLNMSCYSYFSPDRLKFITKNPLTLYVLWFLFEYGYITRDPGFLFEADIPIERQHELACKLYDKYTTNQFRRKFGTYLGLSIKAEPTANTALNNHRNYVLEYAPHRYGATISYLMQYRVFTKHPWKKISYILQKDGVVQNISDLEIALFGSEQSCGKRNIIYQKKVVDLEKSTNEEPKFSEAIAATGDKDEMKQNEIPLKNRNNVAKVKVRKEKVHKYLESLKKSIRLGSLRTTALEDTPLVQESIEEDDVFEEFKAIDSTCAIKTELSQTCDTSLEPLETTVQKKNCDLSPAKNPSFSKCVYTSDSFGELQVAKQKKVEDIDVEDSAAATENISLNNDTNDEGAYIRNKNNKRYASDERLSDSTEKTSSMNAKSKHSKSAVKKSKMHMAKRRSNVGLFTKLDREDSDAVALTEVRSMNIQKPGIETICKLDHEDSGGTTDDRKEAVKKTVKIPMAEIQDFDHRQSSKPPINQRFQVSKRRRKANIESMSQVGKADTKGSTDNTVIVDVKDSESEETIDTQIEKRSKRRRKRKTKVMDRVQQSDAEGNTASSSKTKFSVIEIEDSDPEEVIANPNRKRSSISKDSRDTRKSVSRIGDTNTDGSIDETVIVNIEDTDSEEISSTPIGTRSGISRKTRDNRGSRINDTHIAESTDNIITTPTISTAKISSVKPKRRKMSIVRTGNSDLEEIIDTPNETNTSMSKGKAKRRMKLLPRIEDTSTDGSTLSSGEMSSPVKGSKKLKKTEVEASDCNGMNARLIKNKSRMCKGSPNPNLKPAVGIEDIYTDGSTDNSVPTSKAYKRQASSNAEDAESRKIEKILLVKIENAEKMIRDALSAKRSDTDSEECTADAGNYVNKKCSTSKVRSKKATSKTDDDVTTISSDTTEGNADIIKEVESFLQSSDVKVKKGKGQAGKRKRKLRNSSSEMNTVNENLVKPGPRAYTLRVRSLDELTGRASEKRPSDGSQDHSEVAVSNKRVRKDNEASAMDTSDEVVVINGEVIPLK